MRYVLLIVALVGCRFGFDRAEEGGNLDHDAAISDAARDAAVDAASAGCPASYVTLGAQTSRYRLITNSTVWLTAEQMCEADGTHLAIIDDAAELTAIANALATQNVWTGVTDRVAVGTFRKVTGAAAMYLPWDASEPDASAAECVYLDGLTLKLCDQDCTSGRRAACECDGVSVDTSAY